jgi:outer membrane receptor protein involved in Fe transport
MTRISLPGKFAHVSRIAPALAGAAIVAGTPCARADEQVQLPTITITAQKRTEDILAVPISAMAMDQETMDKLGVKDITDIARLVPGLTFQSTDDAGDTNIAIRGIISEVGDATTGIYLDDVPIMVRQDSYVGSNPYPKVFDLDRVEVLRGPQGTLFGAGAEGGAVRFITPEASLRKTTGYASTDLAFTINGSPSWELGAAIGGPISEGTLGYRISAWHREDGGVGNRVDPATGAVLADKDNSTESTVVHTSLKLAATPNLSITPSVFYQVVHSGDIGLYLESAGPYSISSPIEQPKNDRFVLPMLGVDYDFGAFNFKSISSYINRQINQTYDSTGYLLGSLTGSVTVPFDPDYLAVAHYIAAQSGFTQEFRFTSTDAPESRISWVSGLFWKKGTTMTGSIYQDPNFNALSNYLSVQGGYGPGNSLSYFGEAPLLGSYIYTDSYYEETSDLAVFGDLTYKITPSIKTSVGVRIARSGFSYQDFEDGPWGPAAPFFEQGSQTETPVTPRFNITDQLDQDRMVYASIAKGYRIGGANEPVPVGTAGGCQTDLAQLGLTQVPSTFNSDSLWSYEVGAKGHFLDRRLLIESSAYWINWKQIQQSVNLVECGYNYISNLGKAVSRGLDLQTEWLATKHVVVDATAGWTDAFYDQTLVQDGQLLTKAGDKLPTPLVTATIGSEYRYTPWAGAEGFARMDYDYNGGYLRSGSIDTFGNYPLTNNAPPVRYLSARIGFKTDVWDASLYGNNLANERTSLFRYETTTTTGDLKDTRMRPLTVGISAKYRF